MTVVYKNNLNKIRKIQVLGDFCGYFGPDNYVSMRKRGTCCIAPRNFGAFKMGPQNYGAFEVRPAEL